MTTESISTPLLYEKSGISTNKDSASTLEQGTVLVAMSRLPSTQAQTHESLGTRRAIKLPSWDTIRNRAETLFITCFLPIFGCAACITIIVFIVKAATPGPIIHPNECDMVNTIEGVIVNDSRAFLTTASEGLLAQNKVNIPIQSLMNTYANALGQSLNTTAGIYFYDCSQTSKWIGCVQLSQFFIEGLKPAKPLITQSLGFITDLANITLTPQAKEEFIRNQLNHLCQTALDQNQGCSFTLLCRLIQ